MPGTQYLQRTAGIGDVLWLEPVIRVLAKKHKKIILHTRFPELFDNYPLHNVKVTAIPPGWQRALIKVLNFFSGGKIYHRLDSCYEKTPKKHILHSYQSYFSLPLTEEYPVIFLNDEERKPLAGMPSKYIVLHLEPSSIYNFRKVYGVDWNEIIYWLKEKGVAVITTGNSPLPFKDTVFFKGSLRQLMTLIYHAIFLIGVDSGPANIAAALHKPALIFFGSVNPDYRHFRKLFNGYILQQPCEFAGCYHETLIPGGQSCKLVGDAGIPKCSVHTTERVKESIDSLLNDTGFRTE